MTCDKCEMWKDRADSATAQNARLIASNEELRAKLARAAELAVDSSAKANTLADALGEANAKIKRMEAGRAEVCCYDIDYGSGKRGCHKCHGTGAVIVEGE